MKLGTLQRRMHRMETTRRRGKASIFSPVEGVVPDEYDPDTDTLMLHAIYYEDPKEEQPDNKFVWRGDEYSPECLPAETTAEKSNGKVHIFTTIYEARPQQ